MKSAADEQTVNWRVIRARRQTERALEAHIRALEEEGQAERVDDILFNDFFDLLLEDTPSGQMPECAGRLAGYLEVMGARKDGENRT